MHSFKPLAILLLLANICYSQTTPPPINYEQSVIPLSPSGASLAKYIDYPVSYSTGVPDISLPLYTLKSKSISIPISLSYHAGGIKVSDGASNLGIGWTLNAGGSVSRMVKDIPDETQYGFFNMIYPDENGSLATLHSDYCLANHVVDTYTSGSVKFDGEPDMFYYGGGSLSGSFVFHNRTAVGIDPTAATMPFSPVQITWNQQQYFTIRDLNGDVYQFGNVTNSKDYSSNQSLPFKTYGPITNAWHLTKIVSADKTDSVSFSYEIDPFTVATAAVISSGILKYPLIGPPTATSAVISYGGSQATNTTVRLKEIVGINGKVDFSYDNNNRLSTISIYKIYNGNITEIKSFNISQSAFTTIPESSFSNGLIYSGIQRPRLDSIQEVGYINNLPVISNPPYKFNYYSADLPDVNSKSQDMWGYYNGTGNTDMLFVKVASTGSGTNTTFVPAPEKRAVDTAKTKKGVLTRITFPTGGYSNFTLEENQIRTGITTTTTTPQNVGYHLSTFYMQPNDQFTGVSVTFMPNANITGQLKLDLTAHSQCTPSGSCVSNIPEVIVYDVTSATQLADILLVDLYHNTVTSQESITSYTLNPAHQYKIYFPTPGNITSIGQNTQYRIDAIITEPLPDQVTTSTDTSNVFAGGLRIKQIQHNDGRGNTIVKNYNYTKAYFNSQIYNGTYDYIIDNLIRNKGVFIGGDGNLYNLGVWSKSSTNYAEGLNVPVGGTSNSSVSYQEVEEVLTGADGSFLGKNVYTYNTAQDYISNQFPTYRFAKDYIRSQLVDLKTYRAASANSNILIKEVVNNYNNVNEVGEQFPGADSIKFYQVYSDLDYSYWLAQRGTSELPDASYSVPGIPLRTSLGCPVYINQWDAYFHVIPFYYHVVKPLMISTITTTYDMNGQNPIAAEVDYAYDNLAHIQPTRITSTNSDGKVKVETTKYPLDYNYQASCNLQVAVNSFNQQLSALKTQRDQCQQSAISADNISNPTSHANALSAYDTCTTNFNTAVATLVSQYNTAFTQFQSCYATTEAALSPADRAIALMQVKNMVMPKMDITTTINGNQTEKQRNDYLAEDAGSNIIRPQQVNIQVAGNPIEARANFYNYDSSGNLSEQSKTGGPHVAYQWGYNKTYPVAEAMNAKSNDIFYDSFEEGDGNSASGDSKTGHYSHTGTYTKALTSLDSGTYTLTYWQKSGSSWSLQTVSNITVSNGSYAINLSTQIDDIRFYPSTAQMTTYTFDPQIGMTSTTDPKGDITYYEYDGLQRLLNIKDKDGNIIKSFTYHYQGQ